MKKSVFTYIALAVLSGSLYAGTGRKIVKSVQPSYPTLAKQMNLSGTVKIEATVSSSGKITNVKIVGGHPVLSQPAADAARKFQYEPAASETVETISFNFVPSN